MILNQSLNISKVCRIRLFPSLAFRLAITPTIIDDHRAMNQIPMWYILHNTTTQLSSFSFWMILQVRLVQVTRSECFPYTVEICKVIILFGATIGQFMLKFLTLRIQPWFKSRQDDCQPVPTPARITHLFMMPHLCYYK